MTGRKHLVRRMSISLRTWFVVALVLAVSSSVPRAETTNMDVMERLTMEAIEDLLAGMPDGVNLETVTLPPAPSTDDVKTFVSNIFSQVLTSKGIRIYTTDQTSVTDSNSVRLRVDYQAVDFTLVYSSIYRSYLVGGKKVKRRADVDLLVRLIDPRDESILWVSDAAKHYEDQFSYGDIDEIEAGVYAFTKPERTGKKWGKVVEPVVVGGIIVGLIYLFFSNQSGN